MTLLCVDTSAWHRSGHPQVAQAWRSRLDADGLGICDQVRLEIMWSARSSADYDALAEELEGLAYIETTSGSWHRALDVQRQLAHSGGLHHRSVKIADLVIAASAEAAGAAVWHYDADFDRIAEITGQAVEWVAERGSL